MGYRRAWGILVAALLVPACTEDDAGQADEGGSSAATESGGTDTGSETSGATSGPSDCVPGREGCQCLEGECSGTLFCVADECVPGPLFETLDEFNVIGGVRLPIEIDIEADEFSWEQVSGPDADNIDGLESTLLLVDVPPGANPGAQMVFRVSAVRNTIEASYDVRVNVIAADFSNVLTGKGAADNPPDAVGTPGGLDIRDTEAWVISSEGFVSRFSPEGTYVGQYDIGGGPLGGYFGSLPVGNDGDDIDVMYVADATAQRIEAVVIASGEVRNVTDQMTAGGALGPVGDVISVGGGELFFTNRDGGQVFRYYFDNDAQAWTTVEFMTGLGTNPNAIAIGPEPGYLYIGTVGKVWRVPVLPEGTAGDPELYLDLGAEDDLTLEIDSLTFDRGQTIYVGVPGASTLHMARYQGEGQTEVVRSFTDVGAAISSFTAVQFGSGDFSSATLYWVNPASGALGRLPVGVGADN